VAAVSRATMPTLACRVDTATSGRATVVIAEPKPLIDSPAHSKPKSRVRSRPPTRLGRTAGKDHSGASGSVLMSQAIFPAAPTAPPGQDARQLTSARHVSWRTAMLRDYGCAK